MPCAFDPPRQAAEPCIMAQLSPSAIPTGGQLGRPLRGLFLSVARRPQGPQSLHCGRLAPVLRTLQAT